MIPSRLEFFVVKTNVFANSNTLVRIGNFGYQAVEVRLRGEVKIILYIRCELAVLLKKGTYYSTELAFMTFVPSINSKQDNFSFRVEGFTLSDAATYKQRSSYNVNFIARVSKTQFNSLQRRGVQNRAVYSIKGEVQAESGMIFRLLLVAYDAVALELDKLPEFCYLYIKGDVSGPRTAGKSNAIVVTHFAVREEVEGYG